MSNKNNNNSDTVWFLPRRNVARGKGLAPVVIGEGLTVKQCWNSLIWCHLLGFCNPASWLHMTGSTSWLRIKCVEWLLRWPQWPCLLVRMSYVLFLLKMAGLSDLLPQVAKVMGCHLQELGYEKLGFHVGLLLICSGGNFYLPFCGLHSRLVQQGAGVSGQQPVKTWCLASSHRHGLGLQANPPPPACIKALSNEA